MRRLTIVLAALLMVAGFAAETGAFSQRRMQPRQPIPHAIRARGGLPPVTYYGRPLYAGYYGGYGRSYGYNPRVYGRGYAPRYGYRSYGYRPYGYRTYGYRSYGYRSYGYRWR